jgi:hypothetical protein
MSNASKLLIVFVVLGALVAVGAIAYRYGYQQGLVRAVGLGRMMEKLPENMRGFRDEQPFGRFPFRMRPMLPMIFGPRLSLLVGGALALGIVILALFAVPTTKQAPASSGTPIKKTRKA